LTDKSSSDDENHKSIEGSVDSRKQGDTGTALNKDLVVTTKDYVAATLNAWNNCPTIVKK
jgi:hypothetical protein